MDKEYDRFRSLFKEEVKRGLRSREDLNAIIEDDGWGDTITVRPEGSKKGASCHPKSVYDTFFRVGYTTEALAADLIKKYLEVRHGLNGSLQIEDPSPRIAARYLTLRAYPKEGNEFVEAMCPHEDVCDMMLVPVMYIPTYSEFLIQNVTWDYLQFTLHMGVEACMEIARKNLEATAPEVVTVREVMLESGSVKEEDLPPIGDDAPMWILTNRDKFLGASLMFTKAGQEALQEAMHSKMFFIMPSSVHEVIALPYPSVAKEAGIMRDIVRTVNGTMHPENKLSDSLYFYNGKTINICNTDAELTGIAEG